MVHDEHDEALGWMTVEQVGSEMTVTTEHECTLLAPPGEAGQLALSLSGGCSAGRRLDFLRRIQSDVRVWKDRFRGYWQQPASVSWTDSPWAGPPPARFSQWLKFQQTVGQPRLQRGTWRLLAKRFGFSEPMSRA